MKKIKSFLSMLLCLTLLLSALPISVFAITETSENIFAGGDGTAENPYKVSTPEQLDAIRNNLSANYIQINDIDLSNWGNWQPIGKYGGIIADDNKLFRGSFDGNNYTISNMTIIDTSINPKYDYYGFFAGIDGGCVQNTKLSQISIMIDKTTTDFAYLLEEYGTEYSVIVGGIAGTCFNSTISNCVVSGQISVVHCGNSSVGGVVGYGNAIECTNKAKIHVNADNDYKYDGDSDVTCGGIVGSSETINGTIKKCANYGDITVYAGDFAYVGGISGEYGCIEDCVNFGNITGRTLGANSCSNFAANCNIGGIVGATSSNYVRRCVNYGNVSAYSPYVKSWWGCATGSSVGGIVGYCGYYGSGRIYNCVNNSSYTNSYTNDSNGNEITDDAGRIAGYSISINSCYSNSQTSVNGMVVEGSSTDKHGEKCTVEQLVIETTYPDFDFENIWQMGQEDFKYPVLRINSSNNNDSGNNDDSNQDTVNATISYGADRFSFGEDITGYVGDEIDTLVVYTSANENIASFDIKSSNTNIVEIGTIEIGVGDYITSENEHMATIPLKLKAEGTSTITITSPEGVSESVKVTVTADPISDFNAVTYVADRWLDESDVHYPTIHNFMYNFKDPSYETIKILSTDKDFLASVAAWETANVINDPTQIADDMVNKQQYYEAILFSLLSTQYEEGSLTDYIKATEVTKTYKFTKNFTKFVNSIEGIDSHSILTKTLTESEKALISNDLKSLNSSQLLEGLSSCEILIDILDYSKDIEEFVNICGKYFTLLEVQSSTEKLLDTMYELCEVNLLSDADRVCLKEALRCVKNACNSQFGVMLAGIEKGTTQVLQWTADTMCAEMWKALCSSNVYVLCLKAGLSVGITISNTVFSTDKTIAQYYSMLCLNDVRQLVNQAAIKLGQDYKASRSQEDAEAYISAVGFVFDSYLLGCNYAVDFQKIVRTDSLAGKILFKNDNSFESFKKQAESLENEVSLNYTLLQKQWCYNLLDDYPELFDAVAEEIDLQFYANLEHSSIRVDGLSFDYTGTEITPNITVVMNGEKLVLDKDFTVSYSNNVNPGVANVEVTGIGDYHGTNTATFNIDEQWFDKKIDIRNNGRATLMRAFNLRSISTVSNENSTEAPISIHVYDGDKEVALIENGEIVKADIQIIVYGDRITLLMDDKDYRIVVNADQNTNIDYSYNEYDKELILTKTANYNNTILTSTTALTQTTGTDTVMCGNNALTPTYSTLNQNNERHSISVIGGAASSKEASQGEWVSIAAIAPDGYKFVEWQASTDVGLLDKNSANTSFIMSDFDVELAAVFEEELLADISGTITSFGNNEDSLTIKLLQGSIEIDSVQTTDNSYLFEGVASGTYTLEVSKADHVTRTYEIVVTNENIIQDVKIHLLGDVTGDGKVNTIDVNRVYAHVRETNLLTGYELDCANVAGSGSTVNTIDVNRIYAHVKETNLLW